VAPPLLEPPLLEPPLLVPPLLAPLEPPLLEPPLLEPPLLEPPLAELVPPLAAPPLAPGPPLPPSAVLPPLESAAHAGRYRVPSANSAPKAPVERARNARFIVHPLAFRIQLFQKQRFAVQLIPSGQVPLTQLRLQTPMPKLTHCVPAPAGGTSQFPGVAIVQVFTHPPGRPLTITLWSVFVHTRPPVQSES
jgi:hypothetical protein